MGQGLFTLMVQLAHPPTTSTSSAFPNAGESVRTLSIVILWKGGFGENLEGTVLPVILVDEMLCLYGIGVKLAKSVFSSDEGGFPRLQFVIPSGAMMRPARFNAPGLSFALATKGPW